VDGVDERGQKPDVSGGLPPADAVSRRAAQPLEASVVPLVPSWTIWLRRMTKAFSRPLICAGVIAGLSC